MDPLTLGIAAGGALIGGIGSAYNRKKAREVENSWYQQSKDMLNSQYYRDPLTTAGNRSLLKQARKNYEDNLDALQNRAVAGGATFENSLAARQANNESLDKIYTSLLQGEDARRDSITAQKMSLEGQHMQALSNSYLQAAQDWQAWGSQIANSALAFGSTKLLGGGSGAATGAVSADALQVEQNSPWGFAPLAPARDEKSGGLNKVMKA